MLTTKKRRRSGAFFVRSASVGWQARMDRSEAERRSAQRAGDQFET